MSSVNALCAQANFKVFRIQSRNPRLPTVDQNICLQKESEVLPEIKQTFDQIIKVQRQVRDFFNLNLNVHLEALTSVPLEVMLMSQPEGSMNSYSSFPSLTLGVDQAWMGNGIDLPTYVHELGHLLVNDPQSKFPIAMTELAKLPIFSEQVPDMIALSLTGKTQGSDSMPFCVSESMRDLDSNRSFVDSASTFTDLHFIIFIY